MLDLILVQVEFSYFFTPLLSRGARMCLKYAAIFKRAKVTAGKNRTAQGTAHYVREYRKKKGIAAFWAHLVSGWRMQLIHCTTNCKQRYVLLPADPQDLLANAGSLIFFLPPGLKRVAGKMQSGDLCLRIHGQVQSHSNSEAKITKLRR